LDASALAGEVIAMHLLGEKRELRCVLKTGDEKTRLDPLNMIFAILEN
jgi:hypothetical protein